MGATSFVNVTGRAGACPARLGRGAATARAIVATSGTARLRLEFVLIGPLLKRPNLLACEYATGNGNVNAWLRRQAGHKARSASERFSIVRSVRLEADLKKSGLSRTLRTTSKSKNRRSEDKARHENTKSRTRVVYQFAARELTFGNWQVLKQRAHV
jgi:hypothetical protein